MNTFASIRHAFLVELLIQINQKQGVKFTNFQVSIKNDGKTENS